MELRVARKFRVGPKIGSGSFGEIYAGIKSALVCLIFNDLLIYQYNTITLLKAVIVFSCKFREPNFLLSFIHLKGQMYTLERK